MRKGISPVVAVALLLVTAVVAVVGFQTWFNDYSSQIFTDTEQKSSSSVGFTGIDSIESNKLYFNNAGTDAIEITSVSINDVNCYVSGYYSSGLKTIPMSDCTSDGENDVVVITNKGIYNEKVYLKSATYSNPCPEGYVVVPGSYYFELPNFCVMKYEAKAFNETSQSIDADGCAEPSCTTPNWGLSTHYPISNVEGLPWRLINQLNSKLECESLGSSYHLITNREWMTIARNAELQALNWNSSIVGSGFMFSGHDDNNPAGVPLNATNNDSDGFYGTLDSLSSCDGGFGPNYIAGDDTIYGRACAGQRRTHYLSNGEVVWDMASNLMEVIDAPENGSIIDGDSCAGGIASWYSFNGNDGLTECSFISPYSKINGGEVKFEFGPLGNYNAENNIGRIYSTNITTSAIVAKGGLWTYGSYGGIFTTLTHYSGFTNNNFLGFRCAYIY